LGELVQLSISDVRIDHEYPHLSINETPTVGGHEKSVKSDAGIRLVPLHADLLAMGFGEFVIKRGGQDKPTVRLFKDMKYGCDGQASTEYSKIFARVLDKVGLTDPKLVFHSFRHGMEDALRDAGFQPYVIDAILGHADNSIGGKYGKGVSLSVLADAVANMKLPVSLPEVLKPS
jgi:integrase